MNFETAWLHNNSEELTIFVFKEEHISKRRIEENIWNTEPKRAKSKKPNPKTSTYHPNSRPGGKVLEQFVESQKVENNTDLYLVFNESIFNPVTTNNK